MLRPERSAPGTERRQKRHKVKNVTKKGEKKILINNLTLRGKIGISAWLQKLIIGGISLGFFFFSLCPVNWTAGPFREVSSFDRIIMCRKESKGRRQ